MGQEEIAQELKKDKDKWFSIKELAAELGVNPGSVTRAARRLRYAGFVHYKHSQDNTNHGKYLYKYKKGD